MLEANSRPDYRAAAGEGAEGDRRERDVAGRGAWCGRCGRSGRVSDESSSHDAMTPHCHISDSRLSRFAEVRTRRASISHGFPSSSQSIQ